MSDFRWLDKDEIDALGHHGGRSRRSHRLYPRGRSRLSSAPPILREYTIAYSRNVLLLYVCVWMPVRDHTNVSRVVVPNVHVI